MFPDYGELAEGTPWAKSIAAGAPIIVQGPDRGFRYAYTVGLTLHGIPELVVTGQTEEKSEQLLTEFIDFALANRNFPRSSQWAIVGFEREVAEAYCEGAFVIKYLHPVVMAQIALCDRKGRLPWSANFKANGQALFFSNVVNLRGDRPAP